MHQILTILNARSKMSQVISAQLSLVVASSDNGVIGRDGALPWRLPDDLKHFKAVTMGKPVLMGRRTFESIGRALPGGAIWCSAASVPSKAQLIRRVSSGFTAWRQARTLVGSSAAELCVIGGAQIYAVTLPLASRIYLTQVHGTMTGDTYFPLPQLQAPGVRSSASSIRPMSGTTMR
jgi:dihydrofolate reductase